MNYVLVQTRQYLCIYEVPQAFLDQVIDYNNKLISYNPLTEREQLELKSFIAMIINDWDTYYKPEEDLPVKLDGMLYFLKDE